MGLMPYKAALKLLKTTPLNKICDLSLCTLTPQCDLFSLQIPVVILMWLSCE